MFADGAAAVIDGALHFLQQPMAVALLIALLLATRDMRREHAWVAMALALLGAASTLALRPTPWHAPFAAACLAVLAAVSAAALRLPARVLLAASGAGGVALGLSGGVPLASMAEAAGTLSAAAVLLLALRTGWRMASGRWRQARATQFVPRVIAAWLTALGLLMLALAFVGR